MIHRHFRHFVRRHEPKGHWHGQLKAGIGACIGMLAVGGLAIMTGIPLLIAPFGATAVLIFGQPKSPLAQPVNVFGGYLIAAVVAVIVMSLAPGLWWAAAIAVGVTIALMQLLRVTHPPAGAVPLVAFASHLSAALLFTVVVVGALALIAIAVIHHAIPPRHQYPLRVD